MIDRQLIIELARECSLGDGGTEFQMLLERFAMLVAAAERESCAQVAEWEPCAFGTSRRIADAIRAREQND